MAPGLHRVPTVLTRIALGIALLLGTLTVQGCAALALPALGLAAAQAGAGAAVKAGTEYTSSGTAYRTFTQPLESMHQLTLTTLEELSVKVREDKKTSTGYTVKAAAKRRKVTVKLEQVTPKLTRVRLVVKRGWFSKDRATTSEIITQLELKLNERASASPRWEP